LVPFDSKVLLTALVLQTSCVYSSFFNVCQAHANNKTSAEVAWPQISDRAAQTKAHARTSSTNLSGIELITQTLPEDSIFVSFPEVVSHIS